MSTPAERGPPPFAIVMPLRYRNGTPIYGKALQTVLAERPTRVIVAAQPGESRQLQPA